MTTLQTLSVDKSRQNLEETEQQNLQSSSQVKQAPANERRYNSFMSLALHTLTLSLSSFYFGYLMAYISSVDFGTVMKVYNISMRRQVVQGLLVACIPIGGGIGALMSGYCIKNMSRRNSMLLINLLAFIVGLFLFIRRIEVLFVARLLQGMCAGFFSSNGPLMMKEISPTEISGTLNSFHQIMIASGVCFAFVFSLVVSIIFNDPYGQNTWWIVFGLPLVVLGLQTFLLICVYPYETPKYHFMWGEQKRGRELVEKIYKPRYVDSVIQEIKINLGQQVMERNAGDKSQVFTLSAQELSSSNGLHVVRETPRTAVLVAIHLAALQQFCGINAVIAYGGEIVGGNNATLKLVLPILINSEQVFGAIFASYLLSVVGRKSLLQIGAGMSCIGCGVIAAGFFITKTYPGISIVLIVFGLVLFMANFGFTLGPVVWVYLPEIVQPNVLPYATMVNWASAALIMLLFPVIKQKLPDKNPAILFLFFAIWCTLSFFLNKKFVIETQNKGELQISEEYRLGKQIKEI